MNEKYLNLIKQSFRELNIIYIHEINRLQQLKAFLYEQEIKDFYKKVVKYFSELMPLIDNAEARIDFFDEIESNIVSESYFERMDLIFERQFAFISKYEEPIHLYFNDRGSLELLNDLKDRFFYTKISENLPALFVREEEEIEVMTEFITTYGIQEHLIPEMIYDQDMEIYNIFGITPKDMDFIKFNKLKYKHSIQLYYVHIFSRLEHLFKEAFPRYSIKLNNIQYLESDKSRFIQLKQEFNNPIFKQNLFNFLVKHDLIDCELEDFESLFYPSEIIIDFKGTEKQLMLLLKGSYEGSITNSTIDIPKSVEKRFTCGYKKLNFGQLRVSHQNVLKDRPESIIHEFLRKSKN